MPFMKSFGRYQCPKCKMVFQNIQSNKHVKNGEEEFDSTRLQLIDDDYKLRYDKDHFICPICGYEYIMTYDFMFGWKEKMYSEESNAWNGRKW